MGILYPSHFKMHVSAGVLSGVVNQIIQTKNMTFKLSHGYTLANRYL